jgi:hypothetical protein
MICPQHDQSRVDHETRDLGHAPDILDPIRLGESQIAIEAMAYIYADTAVIADTGALWPTK